MCCLLNYALSKSIDTHTHSHALAKKKKKTRRTHLFSSCISENVNHALMPLLLPSVSFFFSVFRSVSWALIYVWLRSQHVRLDLASFFYSFSILPSPPHAFFREGKGTFFFETPLVFMVWINPQRQRENERQRERWREVERWGTEGPVWTRRHCVAPQLCRTDSLHYSTLQQPAPQSTANLLLTGPSG